MRRTMSLGILVFLLAVVASAQTSGGNAQTSTTTNAAPSACTCQCSCPNNDASQCSCRCTCPNATPARMTGSLDQGTYDNSAPHANAQTPPPANKANTYGQNPPPPPPQYNRDQETYSSQGPPSQQANQPVLQERAQRPVSQQAPPPGSRSVQAGTEIHAALDRMLSTKTSQVGDEFTATVSDPVNASDGRTLIPAGTKIRGQIASAEQGKVLPSLRGKGRIDLRFLDMRFPDGTAVPITATLAGVNDSRKGRQRTDEEGGVSGSTTGGRVAKDVGIGAAAGTVAGLIFGSALKGLAIGAIAGGGYVLATSGKDVDIPADSDLHIRLDDNVYVPANAAMSNPNYNDNR